MFVFNRCILPKAVTPLQKIFCGTIGVVIVGGTVTGVGMATVKGVTFIMEKRSESESKKEDSKIYKTLNGFFDGIDSKINSSSNYIDQKPTLKKYIVPFSQGTGFGLGSALTCIAGLSFSYDFYKDTKLFKQEVIGTTECCNIMRSTMKYAIKTPIYGLLISTHLFVSFMFASISFNYFGNFYSNIQNRKLIKNDD